MELTLEQMIEKLLAEMNKSLDQRNPALVEQIAKQVEERMAAKAAEQARANATGIVPGLTANSPEVKNYQITRLLRGALEARRTGSDEAMKRIAPMEYALHLETQRTKDQASSTDSAGGYLVPAQVLQAQLIEYLQAEQSLASLGCTFMDGLVGSPVELPKRTSGTTAYWINHDVTTGATAPTLTDMTFGQLRMTPKTVAARSRLSHRLINLSTPAAETVVREQILFDLNLTMERAAYNGSGVDGEPRGILNTSDVNTSAVGSVSADTIYDNLLSMIQKLREDFALRGNVKWVMPSAIFSALLKHKDLSTQPTQRRFLDNADLTKIMGYDYVVTDLMPANNLVLGNWSEMLVGRWGSLTLKVDDLSVLGLLQTQILASLDCDIQVRHPESFCLGTGVTV